jgi:WD40 repeat protein
MAISPDGSLLASGAKDGTTKLWSMTTRFEPSYLPNCRAIVGIAADSKSLLAMPDDRTGLSPARRSIITRWSLHNKTSIETNHPDLAGMHWETRWTKPAAFHPGGDLFALGRPNGVMELWDVTHTTRIADWQAAGGELLTSAFSQDGQYLAVGSADGTVSVWDHSRRRELKRFPEGGRGSRHLIFSSDGRLLACGGKEGTWVWDLNDGYQPLRLGTLPGEVTWLAFSPDGRLLATSADGDNVTVLWDLPSGRLRTHLRGHLQTVDGLSFAPDGKTLATGGHDRQVKLWNVETGFELATLPLDGACKSLQFSPDGKALAVGYYRVTDGYRLGDGARIEIWQAPTWADIADSENKAENPPRSGAPPAKAQ